VQRLTFEELTPIIRTRASAIRSLQFISLYIVKEIDIYLYFCHNIIMRNTKGQFIKGHHLGLGRKLSDETRKKISLSKIGTKQTEESNRKRSEALKKKRKGKDNPFYGKHHSEESKEKKRLANLGSNNPRYIDGRRPLVLRIRNSGKYKDWTMSIFKRDNWVCCDCGNRGGVLEAHHIKSFSDIWTENNIKTYNEAIECKELWLIENGKTLCKNCHYVYKKK